MVQRVRDQVSASRVHQRLLLAVLHGQQGHCLRAQAPVPGGRREDADAAGRAVHTPAVPNLRALRHVHVRGVVHADVLVGYAAAVPDHDGHVRHADAGRSHSVAAVQREAAEVHRQALRDVSAQRPGRHPPPPAHRRVHVRGEGPPFLHAHGWKNRKVGRRHRRRARRPPVRRRRAHRAPQRVHPVRGVHRVGHEFRRGVRGAGLCEDEAEGRGRRQHRRGPAADHAGEEGEADFWSVHVLDHRAPGV